MSNDRQLALLSDAHMEREKILQYFADNHSKYLHLWRQFAKELAMRSDDNTTCIDEVRVRALHYGLPMPREFGTTDRILGSVFRRQPDWEPAEKIDSTRPERIARSGRNASGIFRWRLLVSQPSVTAKREDNVA